MWHVAYTWLSISDHRLAARTWCKPWLRYSVRHKRARSGHRIDSVAEHNPCEECLARITAALLEGSGITLHSRTILVDLFEAELMPARDEDKLYVQFVGDTITVPADLEGE